MSEKIERGADGSLGSGNLVHLQLVGKMMACLHKECFSRMCSGRAWDFEKKQLKGLCRCRDNS